MQKVLLQLPVPRYLKKILEVKFGENATASRKNLLGLTIISTLKGKRDKDYENSRKVYNSENYRFKDSPDNFFVNVSLDVAKRKGFTHSIDTSKQIVKAFDRDIREQLYIDCIFNKEKYGIEYQTTILNFLDFYDITEEELSYDSLRKDFNRNKKKLAERLKISA